MPPSFEINAILRGVQLTIVGGEDYALDYGFVASRAHC